MKKKYILQKHAVRLIDNSKTMTHSDSIILKYLILKINDMVDFNQATFLFKYTNGQSLAQLRGGVLSALGPRGRGACESELYPRKIGLLLVTRQGDMIK